MLARLSLFVVFLSSAVCAEDLGSSSNVHTLTFDTFDDATREGIWLLKFYAPWCGHCKRLAPEVDRLADTVRASKDPSYAELKVAKINCDEQTALCKRFKIKGYPTLLVKRGELERKYTSERNSASMLEYMAKLTGPSVLKQSTSDELVSTIQSAAGAVFVVSTSSSVAPAWFLSVAANLQGSGAIFVHNTVRDSLPEAAANTCDGKNSLPANAKVAVFVDCHIFVLDGERENKADFLAFVERYRLGLLPELTPSVYQDVVHHTQLCGVYATSDSNDAQLSEMTTLSTKYGHAITFSWINAETWNQFLENFQLTSDKLPALLILDDAGKDGHFVLTGLKQNDFAATTAAFVERVLAGSETRHGYGFTRSITKVLDKLSQQIEEFVSDHPYMAIGGMVVFGVLFLYVLLFAVPDVPTPPSQRNKTAQQAPDQQGDGDEDDDDDVADDGDGGDDGDNDKATKKPQDAKKKD